jgi:dephospho-CoA kinase
LPQLPKEEKIMFRIGLTGGIASGKSLVSGFFADEGIVVLDADKIYKNLLKTNKLLYNEIVKTFQMEELDLQQLSEIVFSDEKKLKALNEIAHPYVLKVFDEQLIKLSKTEKLVVLDVPLLFEAKMEPYCDTIICVYAEEEIQIKRLKNRNSISNQEAIKRIESQIPLKEKCEKSDYIIDNSYDIENTRSQFTRILSKIKESIYVN